MTPVQACMSTSSHMLLLQHRAWVPTTPARTDLHRTRWASHIRCGDIRKKCLQVSSLVLGLELAICKLQSGSVHIIHCSP